MLSKLQDEIEKFTSHDWTKSSEFQFPSIALFLKKDNENHWSIRHSPSVELIVDSKTISGNEYIPLTIDDHFLQVKNSDFASLFVFSPKSISFSKIEDLNGAHIRAERFSRLFVSKKRVFGVESLDFEILPSEFVGVYGESGIGKSVLINSILGTIKRGKVRGTLSITNGFGTKLNHDEIAFLPQTVDIPPYLSCKEILQAAMVDRSLEGRCSMNEISAVLKRCSLDESVLHKIYKHISFLLLLLFYVL